MKILSMAASEYLAADFCIGCWGQKRRFAALLAGILNAQHQAFGHFIADHARLEIEHRGDQTAAHVLDRMRRETPDADAPAELPEVDFDSIRRFRCAAGGPHIDNTSQPDIQKIE